MTPALRSALAIPAAALVAAGALGCGGGNGGGTTTAAVSTTGAQTQVDRGKELFVARCAGCHTLSAAGTRGSATNAHQRERTDGVNFDQRRVSRDDVLFAIRNGGFGSKIMPSNIVTGSDAEAVATYVASVSGREAGGAAAQVESAAARKMKRPLTSPAPDPAAVTPGRTDPRFLRASFDSAQELWRRHFAAAGGTYRPARLILFHNAVHTPCGTQPASVGPFYCPPNETVYLNTDFFDALARRFALRRGWAAGYVTAHEVGHHVQTVLGVLQRVAQLDAGDPQNANRRSVLVELQADCYAGVWLHELAGAGRLSDADIEDILRAAAVVGDDFQRNQAGKPLAPETWTHGSSEQRRRWFSRGYEKGTPAACDTFSGSI
jgi:predicted metalloprotease